MGMVEVLRWFDSRGISEGTVREEGIYCGMRQSTGGGFEVSMHPDGDVICFPYRQNNETVNVKYREKGKRFYQLPGGKKVLYGNRVLSDSQLWSGKAALVIVEGEMDYLAVKESGYPFVVSVPDGAPPPGDGEGSDAKYSYLMEHWEELKHIKRIVIATDADAAGQRLAQDLVRRLGRPRCAFALFPEACKDMNDVLLKYGQGEVYRVIQDAIECHISGLYTLDKMPPRELIRPVTTGFRLMDELLLVYRPALMVVTGLPGNGKSTWTNQMAAQLVCLHDWKIGIASFEMVIHPYVTRVLEHAMLVYKKIKEVDRLINESFVFITPEETEEEDQFDIDWLIDKAIAAVVRHGINVLVIDPWNEVEHYCRRGESLTEYTGRVLRMLKKLAKDFDLLVIVVAHPTKASGNKEPEEIGLYDVSDSAHFANKADLGVVVMRHSPTDLVTRVFVKKVRYQPDTGRLGEIQLTFDPGTNTFSQ